MTWRWIGLPRKKKHKLDLVLLKHWTQQWEKLFEKGRLPQKLLTRDDLTSYLMKRPTSATKECLNGRWGAIAHQLYVYYRMLFEFVYSREIWRLEHFFFTDMIFFQKTHQIFPYCNRNWRFEVLLKSPRLFHLFFYCLSIGFYSCHGQCSINITKNCNKRISMILIFYTQFCLFLSPLRKARYGCTTQSNAHF